MPSNSQQRGYANEQGLVPIGACIRLVWQRGENHERIQCRACANRNSRRLLLTQANARLSIPFINMVGFTNLYLR